MPNPEWADLRPRPMAHEIAKLLLERAGTFLERTEAIKAALYLGMPLREIQEYLDWLDYMKPRQDGTPEDGQPQGDQPKG